MLKVWFNIVWVFIVDNKDGDGFAYTKAICESRIL